MQTPVSCMKFRLFRHPFTTPLFLAKDMLWHQTLALGKKNKITLHHLHKFDHWIVSAYSPQTTVDIMSEVVCLCVYVHLTDLRTQQKLFQFFMRFHIFLSSLCDFEVNS